jgi:hydrogenase nickel incorporation protein HypA/HybF
MYFFFAVQYPFEGVSMHEWALATEIIKLAEKEAASRNSRIIAELEVKIGALNRIVKEQLLEAFAIAKIDTIMASAELKIIEVEARGRCLKCANEFKIELPFICCSNCGNMDISVESGEEMHLSRVVLDFD